MCRVRGCPRERSHSGASGKGSRDPLGILQTSSACTQGAANWDGTGVRKAIWGTWAHSVHKPVALASVSVPHHTTKRVQ